MVEHTDARTRRGKARMRPAKTFRDVRARFSRYERRGESGSSIVVFSPIFRNTREPSRGRRSPWPCSWAGWSGGPFPRGVGSSMTHQARRGSSGHRVPQLHCRLGSTAGRHRRKRLTRRAGPRAFLDPQLNLLAEQESTSGSPLRRACGRRADKAEQRDTFGVDGRSWLKWRSWLK
jgi:hypothetical protein